MWATLYLIWTHVYFFKLLGRGIIAKRDIAAGEYIVYYHGTRTTDEPADEDDYFFEIQAGPKTFW